MWVLFAEVDTQPSIWAVLVIVVGGIFGSGGIVAAALKIVQSRTEARIKRETEEATEKAKQRVDEAESKSRQEKERYEREEIRLKMLLETRAEATTNMHQQYKDVIAMLKAEIVRSQREDKERRVEMRDEIVSLREEVRHLKHHKQEDNHERHS